MTNDMSNRELFDRLMTAAAGLIDPHSLDDPEAVNHEYQRGQAELIADAVGLSASDDKDAIIMLMQLRSRADWLEGTLHWQL